MHNYLIDMASVNILHFSKDPITWNVKLISTSGRSIVTSTFHHSLKPLFPPCIFNKYGKFIGYIMYINNLIFILF